MLQIETSGSWRETGQQVGDAFRQWFPPVLEHFAPWLSATLDSYRPAPVDA